jgi:hypothetical protein
MPDQTPTSHSKYSQAPSHLRHSKYIVQLPQDEMVEKAIRIEAKGFPDQQRYASREGAARFEFANTSIR